MFAVYTITLQGTYRIARNINWQELNLAVGSQIAITNTLADLNLAVAQAVCQSAKFSGYTVHVYAALRQFFFAVFTKLFVELL